MKEPIRIRLADATTPELIDRAIEERLAPGLAANRWRSDFAAFRDKRLWAERHQDTMLRKLKAALGDLRGRRILDLGTGRGGLAVALARAGCAVVAMDLRKRNLETTMLRGRRHGLRPPVAVAVGERLPFAAGTFDLVICKDMLEHCQDPSAVLAEIRRVLAPGGAAYLTVVNRFPFRDPHYHLWFVNFLPARLGDRYVSWRGRGKESFRDHQLLSDMHYFAWPRFARLARAQGLRVRRDLHGLGRRRGPIPVIARLRRVAGDCAYGLGRRLSLGIQCFELLVEPDQTPGRPPRRRLLAAVRSLVSGLLAGAFLAAGPAQAVDFSILGPGLRVEVKGRMSESRFSASRLTLKADDGHAIDVKAPIEAIPAAGTPGPDVGAAAGTFQLLGRPVAIMPDARVRGAEDPSALMATVEPGTWVTIKGRDRGEWIAVESITLRPEGGGSTEIEGPIDAMKRRGSDRVLLEIGGFEIEVDRNAELLRDQGENAPRLDPRFVDQDDARPRSFLFLDGRVALGGQLRWDMDSDSNMNLDENAADDLRAGFLSMQVEADVKVTPRLVGFAKAVLLRGVGFTEETGTDVDQTDLRLEEAYLLWNTPLRQAAVQIGRQDFDEPREWLYDENLDAVRFRLSPTSRTAVELSVAGRLNGAGAEGERGYALAQGRVDLIGKSWAGAYVMGRNDPVAGDDARWFGLRAMGAPRRGFDPWLELGWIRGATGDGNHHGGSAVDVGATIQPAALLRAGGGAAERRPAFTIGWARGSGDHGADPGTDGAYRQTGFEDNNADFGGISSFNYYGLLLDPELSNLEILTFGAGVRVARETSIDLVYHRYRQDVPDNRLRADLAIDPLGENAYLGSEADLIFGMRRIENLEIELDVAAFLPGRAFGDGATTATRASLQFKYNY